MKEIGPFVFDPELSKAVGRYLGDRIDFSSRIKLQPYEILDFISPEAEKEIRKNLARPVTASQLLYYFCMSHRRMDPGFFPPQDICMLMANLAGTEWMPSQVALEDIRLLPSAILLTGRHWRICLPTGSEEFRERLGRLLGTELFSDQPESPDRPTVWLGGDPLQVEMTDEAKKRRPAYHLANWDFLGVRGNEYYRRFWLDEAGISAVLQLPRPPRQGISIYPAIIRSGEGAAKIRMAQIQEVKGGDGGLDQALAMSLLASDPDGVNSAGIDRSAIAANPGCNLTPAFWLTGKAEAEEALLKLGDCAQIIRCQVPRTKYQELCLEDYGPQANGYFIAREVGMGALQTQCGFLLDNVGDQVSLEFKRKDNQYKYLLKENDILFSFRGTAASLGKVGFVDHDPDVPSVTGTAFYIIRPLETINPIWLYWQLQTEELRTAILARSSGVTTLNISVDDTRSLPIRRPKPEELEKILGMRARISERMRELSKVTRGIMEEVRSLKSAQD